MKRTASQAQLNRNLTQPDPPVGPLAHPADESQAWPLPSRRALAWPRLGEQRFPDPLSDWELAFISHEKDLQLPETQQTVMPEAGCPRLVARPDTVLPSEVLAIVVDMLRHINGTRTAALQAQRQDRIASLANALENRLPPLAPHMPCALHAQQACPGAQPPGQAVDVAALRLIANASQMRHVAVDLNQVKVERIEALLQALTEVPGMISLRLDAALNLPQSMHWTVASHMDWLETFFMRLHAVHPELQIALKLSAMNTGSRHNGVRPVRRLQELQQQRTSTSNLLAALDKLLRCLLTLPGQQLHMLSLQLPMPADGKPPGSLLDYLAQNHTLQAFHLDLANWRATFEHDHFLDSLASTIHARDELQDFSLSCQTMPPASIFACVRRLELQLPRHVLGGHRCQQFAASFTAAPRLAELCFIHCTFNAEELAALAAGLGNCPRLVLLELHKVQLDQDGWHQLAAMLPGLPGLRLLRLVAMEMPDAVRDNLLGDALALGNPHLQVLLETQPRYDPPEDLPYIAPWRPRLHGLGD